MENGQFQRLLQEIQESRRHTDQVAAELRDELRGHTDQVAAGLRDELRGHTDQVAAGLRGHTDQAAGQLRAEIRETAAESRRHLGVMVERLEARDELLAEGIASIDEKVDRLRGDMNAEFAETRSMIKLSYRELDRRITTLEERA